MLKKMNYKWAVAFIAIVSVALVSSANAQLLHRYSFDSSADDSVGTANGTLMNGAAISGGALVTNGNNGGISSKWGASGPYCALDSSAVSGISGAFTVEAWFTCTSGWPKNDTLFSFTDDTTVGDPGGSSASYLFGTPVTYDPWCCDTFVVGGGGALTRAGGWDWQMKGNPPDGPGYADQDKGSPYQLLVTYDGATFTMYVDGQVANHVSSVSDAGFNLSSLTDVGLNGGNPYGDAALTGSTYDFRIYSGSLSADQVASVYALGSDASNSAINAVAVPEPGTIVLLVAGIVCLLCARFRKN
jgi:Concanavalin A-like lectin/glucanases superfamily/PEP-CTERM motif